MIDNPQTRGTRTSGTEEVMTELTGGIGVIKMNNLKSFLVPPVIDGGLAGELAEAESTIYSSALKDAVTYLVDNAVNNAGHDVRRAINIRYNLKWADVDRIVSRAQTLVGPEIERVRSEHESAEQRRIYLEHLTGLFNALGLHIQPNNDRYDLLGLTETQLRSCAEILTGAVE